MVINIRYKFIFVHIPKSAGTSISHALMELDGNYTKWLASTTKHETLKELCEHMPGRRSVVDKLLLRSIRDYFRFGFVRNPWERMVSFYRYLVKMRPREEIDTISSFSDFLKRADDGVPWIMGLHAMRPQVDYIDAGNSKLDIDFLGHYEYLDEDIAKLAQEIGIILNVPHLNRTARVESDYRKAYDDKSVEIVAHLFDEDIQQFEYRFECKYPGKRCSGVADRNRRSAQCHFGDVELPAASKPIAVHG